MLGRPFKLTVSLLSLAGMAGLALIGMVGCNHDDKPVHQPIALKPLYPTLPPKNVPVVFKNSLLERCDLSNTDMFQVSGYGLVVNLAGTGDSQAPNLVRNYIVELMVKHKWGSSLSGIAMPTPEQALRDPRVAIVQVDGLLPPGVRQGQPFDVQVSAMPNGNTTSLAGGDLLETELRVRGANPTDPGGAVNVYARAVGPLFVNPAYALDSKAADDPAARRSLRSGWVMNGARSLADRPLAIRLRTPSMRMSRFIEDRVNSRFQEIKPNVIAAAQDEGMVNFFVPPDFLGDWEHFSGVVMHLYLDGSPEFAATKAKELADDAVKPNAPLMDISYAWEGIGKGALPVILDRQLMSSPNQDIAYAATRAAAFLGDQSAPQALVNMARMPEHKFQINAIQALGALRNSPAINEMLRPLLDSPQTLVRLEAYKMLARNGDNSVFSTPVKSGFKLDVVRSGALSVIYATRRGEPRIAVIGNRTSLQMPVTFTAMDGRLSISSDAANRIVTIFYRPAEPPGGVRTREAEAQLEPIKILSQPDIAEIIARLGGEGGDGNRTLNFNYGQIVSILSNLTGQQKLVASAGGVTKPAEFMLQELPGTQDTIYNAPVITDQGRPQADEPGKVGLAR